jgi:hypothetical protein
MNMLEHQKILLTNSVHDREMFRKELVKSLKWLDRLERQKLYLWLKEQCWQHFSEIIESVFNMEAA